MRTSGASNESEAGLEMRRQVLRDAHVNRSMAQVSDVGRPVHELVTELCWGAIWTRPGLDPKTRSLLNLVMLTAMNGSYELGIHVRGAVTNGCSREEIQEALLQTLVDCGAPAALEAFRLAESVLDEMESA